MGGIEEVVVLCGQVISIVLDTCQVPGMLLLLLLLLQPTLGGSMCTLFAARSGAMVLSIPPKAAMLASWSVGFPKGSACPCKTAAVKLCSLSESSAYLNATAVGITSGLIQSRLGSVSMLDASSAAAVQM